MTRMPPQHRRAWRDDVIAANWSQYRASVTLMPNAAGRGPSRSAGAQGKLGATRAAAPTLPGPYGHCHSCRSRRAGR
jgi:hypothetical protein